MNDESMSNGNGGRASRYMNPYIGGVLLGLVLLGANFISGRGLGASGAIKSAVVAGTQTVAPGYTAHAPFFREYHEEHSGPPMKNWLVFQMIGVVVGAFASGALAGRLKFKTDHGPRITSRKRLVMALAGGILFGLGSQLGRGCTSGSALSGMAVISFGGIITMLAIFGGGYTLAYFFRKNWI